MDAENINYEEAQEVSLAKKSTENICTIAFGAVNTMAQKHVVLLVLYDRLDFITMFAKQKLLCETLVLFVHLLMCRIQLQNMAPS